MRRKFPENFMWGAAASAYQVEGNNDHSDWWDWEQAGHIKPSGEACDHYNRFREDFHIAKALGHNTHRLGLEWSRLEKSEGVWDEAEWDHYREVIDELIKLGIETIVTLNHFTVPRWFSRKGRWLNDDSVKYFSRFAERAIEELGDRVTWWLTINEPCVVAMGSYLNSKWPPEKFTFYDALDTLRNMLKSHVAAYKAMKEIAQNTAQIKEPKISIAKSVTAFHPCSKYSIKDRMATFLRSNFYNHAFVKSAITGIADFMPFFHEKLSAKHTLDFIALNYYTREFIHYKGRHGEDSIGKTCPRGHHEVGEITDMGWEIYPEGMYEMIKNFSQYRLPIFITENGIAASDPVRKNFIKAHLEQVLRAINRGSPVIGYLYWSLLDNFEWAEGYRPRFGLVHVDYITQQRTIKESARYLSGIIRTGEIQD
ncbi:MAG: glycoside hydrolase family 1 protein [Candidatus Omnitrophota bacterium]